jgi:hypothetical protein
MDPDEDHFRTPKGDIDSCHQRRAARITTDEHTHKVHHDDYDHRMKNI